MILRKFRENNPILVFLVPIIMVASFVLVQFFSNQTSYAEDSFVQFIRLNEAPKWIVSIIVALIVSLSGTFLGVLFNRNEFFERNSYVTVLIFGLFSLIVTNLHLSLSVHLTNLLNIGAIYYLFKAHESEKWKGDAFKIGFLVGLGSILTPANSVFALMVLIGLISLKGFSFRNTVLNLLGIAIPFLYLFIFQFIVDGTLNWSYAIDAKSGFVPTNWLRWSLYGCFAFGIVLSLVSVQLNRYNSIKFKERSRVLALMLILGLILIVVLSLFKIFIWNIIVLFPVYVLLISSANVTKKLSVVTDIVLYAIIVLWIISLLL